MRWGLKVGPSSIFKRQINLKDEAGSNKNSGIFLWNKKWLNCLQSKKTQNRFKVVEFFLVTFENSMIENGQTIA